MCEEDEIVLHELDWKGIISKWLDDVEEIRRRIAEAMVVSKEFLHSKIEEKNNG